MAEQSVDELARTCAASASEEDWRELIRRCAPLISQIAIRVSRVWGVQPTKPLLDDIVQEVFLKLCFAERRILRNFQPRGEDSFFRLLHFITRSVANDYFRRFHSEKRGGKAQTVALNEFEPGVGTDRNESAGRVQQLALFDQLDAKLRSAPEMISDRDRDLFWLYYGHGFTAEEIARVSGSGLTAKGVESALHRVSTWLRGQVGRKKSAPS